MKFLYTNFVYDILSDRIGNRGILFRSCSIVVFWVVTAYANECMQFMS
jgi:hypothetical protein